MAIETSMGLDIYKLETQYWPSGGLLLREIRDLDGLSDCIPNARMVHV